MKLRKYAVAVAAAAALTVITIPAAMASQPQPSAPAAVQPANPSVQPRTTLPVPVPYPGASQGPLIHGITEQCDHTFFYCLNDVQGGGVGAYVSMYYGGFTNDAFNVSSLGLMCHDGHVHASAPYGPCPWPSNQGLDNAMNGAEIFALASPNNGLCVGTTSSVVGAFMENCPDSFGNGGGYGTIWILASGSQCSAGNNYYAENRYWSGAYNALSSLEMGSQIGNQAFVAHNDSVATCWGSYVS